MARRLERDRLVIASHNAGKLTEIAELVAPFGVDAVSAGSLGLPEPEETGATFQANAELKALAAAEGAGLPAGLGRRFGPGGARPRGCPRYPFGALGRVRAGLCPGHGACSGGARR
jgi:hypothetical protein